MVISYPYDDKKGDIIMKTMKNIQNDLNSILGIPPEYTAKLQEEFNKLVKTDEEARDRKNFGILY